MLRKQWLKHGDDPFVMRSSKGQPQELGLFPTPMGCITVRPGDWIVIDDLGRRTIETDHAILSDLARIGTLDLADPKQEIPAIQAERQKLLLLAKQKKIDTAADTAAVSSKQDQQLNG